ncbi:MAG: hypothetical protein KAS04_00420, partial [Candidatus Aenigmarchaeota archaeon]|nr:hypothetical protein [Candidatus Aenigmarchaeota archaeon]
TDEKGVLQPPSYVSGSEEEAISLRAHEKGLADADKKVADTIKTEQIIREKYWKDAFSELDNYKDNPDAAKEVMYTRAQEFVKNYGPEMATKMGIFNPRDEVMPIYDSWLAGGNAKADWLKKNTETYWTMKNIYRKDNTEENLQKVRKAYYAVPEDDRKGLETPKDFQTRFPSKEMVATKNKIKKAEAKIKADAKATEKPKVLTRDQLNKRVRDLEQAKLKAQTTKGMDPFDMWLMKDNPKAQEAFKQGDSTALVKEIDEQLKYYRGLREGKKPTAKKTTKKDPKRKKYGILDARKELDKLGQPMTPENIKEVLTQLNAN